MPALLSQKDMRPLKKLPFCYLCGETVNSCAPAGLDDDDVLPTSLFLEPDRNFPLTLPTHKTCNNQRSEDDRVIGQLVGLLHGIPLHPVHNKLKVAVGQFEDGAPAVAVTNLNFQAIIRRWLRGF